MKIKDGLAIIISSPSGAGKTTITKHLIKKINNSHLSISCTTREPRPGEKDGIDYFFISKKQFFNFRKKKKFIESATVHGNLYGTLKSQINNNLKKNKIVFLDVDWQGARVLRKKVKKNLISFFLLPPSKKILKERLYKRHIDNPNLAKKRFSTAKKDILHWMEYNYVFINDDLKKCVNLIYKKIKNIVEEQSNKTFVLKILKQL